MDPKDVGDRNMRIVNGLDTTSRNKKTGEIRSSASSQGSNSIRDELTLRDSSSTSSADEEHLINMEKRRKKPRKQRAVLHRHMDDDDDERTDSAEEEEVYGNAPRHPQAPPTYPPGSGITFDPPSILKPLSPSMLTVGYGAELRMTRPQLSQEDYTSTLMSSPHQSEGHGSLGGGATGLSPDQTAINHATISVEQEGVGGQVLPLVPTSLPSVAALSNGGSTSTVLNSSSSIAANALPFAGWWGQHTTPIYSPFCGPSGSVATTPVATDTSGLLRPGSNVLLRAVICQESEGVLIVNVHWRNKSYSGSLIDVSQHQWAPPRLMEGFQEVPVQVKDLYSKLESEKEAVEVVDEEKDDDIADVDSKQTPEDSDDVKPPPTSNENKEPTDSPLKSVSNEVATISKPNPSDLLMKPPNGFKVPVVLGSTITDKLKPVLPAFDAVKSPQPQIGRDDNSEPAKKKESVSNSPIIPETHHNLNTLVDVAAKMKHVSNEVTPTTSSTGNRPGNDGGKGPTPPQSVSGNESDSSGSGSISPLRKQHQQTVKESGNKETKEERPPAVGAPPTITVPPPVQPENPLINSGAPPFSFDATANSPRSPDKPHSDERLTFLKRSINSKQIGLPWIPPAAPLDQKDTNRRGVSPMPISNIAKPGVLPVEHHTSQPLPLPPHPPSVIQDKKHNKRKRQPVVNEVSKRPSPPLKEIDNSPLTSTSSLLPNRQPFELLMPGQEQHHILRPDQPHPHLHPQQEQHHILRPDQPHPHPPPGFQYDPSIPMPYDLQVVSYTREKAAEAGRNLDRSTPPSKVPKRPHAPYEHLSSIESHSSSRSPPLISSSNKRSTTGSGSKISPGVVVQSDHRSSLLPGMIQPQVKQEMHHSNSRPSRPPSKGGVPHGASNPSSKTSSSGHSSRKSHPPSRRPDHPSVMIKQEPPDSHGPGGQHMLHGGHPGPFAFQPMTFPLVINSPPSSTVNHQNPSWIGSVISNPSSQSHRRTPNDLPVPRSSITRTPSPGLNPHKKPDWQQPAHHINPQQHQQTVKHEQMTSRHQALPTGDKHTSSHGSSSSSHGHHSNKHDPSHSARHVLAQSHSIPPTAQAISPSYIADLRNGVQMNDWVKQMQLMQLEALHKGGIVTPTPLATPAATATAIPTPVHPQELALWHAQMAAVHQLPAIDQATALQMQLALQQQQQQQQNEAVTQAFTAQGLFPLMQPFPVGTQVLPFSSLTQTPKRDP